VIVVEEMLYRLASSVAEAAASEASTP
jgi:hypothetical protein